MLSTMWVKLYDYNVGNTICPSWKKSHVLVIFKKTKEKLFVVKIKEKLFVY